MVLSAHGRFRHRGAGETVACAGAGKRACSYRLSIASPPPLLLVQVLGLLLQSDLAALEALHALLLAPHTYQSAVQEQLEDTKGVVSFTDTSSCFIGANHECASDQEASLVVCASCGLSIPCFME